MDLISLTLKMQTDSGKLFALFLVDNKVVLEQFDAGQELRVHDLAGAKVVHYIVSDAPDTYKTWPPAHWPGG